MLSTGLTNSITNSIARKIEVYTDEETGQCFIILDSGNILQFDNNEDVEIE